MGDLGYASVWMSSDAPILAEHGVVFQTGADRPQTHVLIVGVGTYPNFQGGISASDLSPLGQLNSPAPSARAITDWFLNEYNYPSAPIGSVAVLCSEAVPAPLTTKDGTWRLPNPTYATFSAAAQAWFTRGNTDEQNRLVFLFCGHGYGNGFETSLLMSDFDFRRDDKWDCALDLAQFIEGMAKCAAEEQVFLIDACRRPHGDLLAPRAAIGRSPIQPVSKPRAKWQNNRNAPVFFSTGDGKPARGRATGTSVFTEAFLRAMRGMGARDDTGEWLVNNFSMLEAMNAVSTRLTEKSFPESQQPQGTEARRLEFHQLLTDPISPIYISRADQTPCGPGELRCYVAGELDGTYQACTDDDHEIEIDLPIGDYDFELRSPDKPTVSAQQRSAPTFKQAKLR